MASSSQVFLVSPGPRPSLGLVAESLWPGRDVDTDGNCETPASSSWTELTIALRPGCAERVDVDPVSFFPLVLRVSATSNELACGSLAMFEALAEVVIGATQPSAPHAASDAVKTGGVVWVDESFAGLGHEPSLRGARVI